tara:strand:+ start:1391 stop:1648 length:258 start_codon:yes stop_codon:yes gene_type:complete
MKTYIVLIPLEENDDARKQCEQIENTKFSLDNKSCIQIKKMVIELINDTTYNLDGIEVWAMSEFMEWCNDEQFNPVHYFMSYVYA